MTAKDADGEDKRKRIVFTLRRESDSDSALRVLGQPGFGTGRSSGLSTFPRPMFGCQPVLTLHPKRQQPSWSEQQPTDSQPTTAGRCVKPAKITPALPLSAVKTKAYLVIAYLIQAGWQVKTTVLNNCPVHLTSSKSPTISLNLFLYIFNLILLFPPTNTKTVLGHLFCRCCFCCFQESICCTRRVF